jgi:hypothetical protein
MNLLSQSLQGIKASHLALLLAVRNFHNYRRLISWYKTLVHKGKMRLFPD